MATGTSTLEGIGTFKLKAREARKLNNIAENRLQQALSELANKRQSRIQQLGRSIVKAKFEVGVLSAEKEVMAITKYRKGIKSKMLGSKSLKHIIMHNKPVTITEESSDTDDEINCEKNGTEKKATAERKSFAHKEAMRGNTKLSSAIQPTTETQFVKRGFRSTSNANSWTDQMQAYQVSCRTRRSGKELELSTNLPRFVNSYLQGRPMLPSQHQRKQFHIRNSSAKTFPLMTKRQNYQGNYLHYLNSRSGKETDRLPSIARLQDFGSRKDDNDTTLNQYYSCIARGHFSNKKLQLDPPKIKVPNNDVRLILHTFPPITRRRVSSRLPPIIPPSQQRLQGTGKFRRAAVRVVKAAEL